MVYGVIQEVTGKVKIWETKMETISQTSRKTLLRLIRKEFDNMDSAVDWAHNDSDNLIRTAMELGFGQLAIEMKNDKKIW